MFIVEPKLLGGHYRVGDSYMNDMEHLEWKVTSTNIHIGCEKYDKHTKHIKRREKISWEA